MGTIVFAIVATWIAAVRRAGGLTIAAPQPQHMPGHPDVPADAWIDRSPMGHYHLRWVEDGVPKFKLL